VRTSKLAALIASLLLLIGLPPHSSAVAACQTERDPAVLGWYIGGADEVRPTRLASYERTGMTLVVAPYAESNTLHTFLDQAHRVGVGVLLAPNGNWIRTGDWPALAAFIGEFQDEPAVAGWYLFDEPDFNNLPATRLIQAYQLVQLLDPSHPIAVVFTLGQCRFGRHLDRRYLQAFDLLMCDDYPFYTFVRSHSQSLAAIREFQDTTRHAVYTARHFHKLGPIMVAQGFGNGVKDGPFWYRDPTYVEQRAMFHDALAAGAKGILYFNDEQADGTVKSDVHAIVSQWYHTSSHTVGSRGDPVSHPSFDTRLPCSSNVHFVQ
jgi:hypothetical protein